MHPYKTYRIQLLFHHFQSTGIQVRHPPRKNPEIRFTAEDTGDLFRRQQQFSPSLLYDQLFQVNGRWGHCQVNRRAAVIGGSFSCLELINNQRKGIKEDQLIQFAAEGTIQNALYRISS